MSEIPSGTGIRCYDANANSSASDGQPRWVHVFSFGRSRCECGAALRAQPPQIEPCPICAVWTGYPSEVAEHMIERHGAPRAQPPQEPT